MSNYDSLGRKYDAYISSDGTGFRRRVRILQSVWRKEHGYPIGLHRGQLLGSASLCSKSGVIAS